MQVEGLNKALDLVEELVPRFKSIHEMLKAQLLADVSVGNSHTAWDEIQQALDDLLNELDRKKTEV